MKKTIVFLLAVVMVLSLVACGQSTEPSTTQQPSGETSQPKPDLKDVTITYMASQDWVQDAEFVLAERFTEETGIKVDFQIVPSDQYPNLLTTKLNSGECADIFGSQGGRFDIVTTLNVEKNAVDLSGEAWTKTMDAAAAAEVSVDGKIYGQPLQDVSAVWAVAYNKKIFSDLELSIPTTWAEFTAVCDTIMANGITPIYEPVSDGWHHVLWFAELGAAYDKAEPGLVEKLNSNQTKLADSAVLKLAIEQIKEMAVKGYWGNNYMADAYSDQPAKMASGEYAMTVANQGLSQLVADLDQGLEIDDIGYFVMPIADNQILNVNPVCPTRFIYSGSKNIEAAKMYLEFIARPENLQYLIDNVSKFQNLPYSGLTPKYAGEIKAFYDRYEVAGTVLQSAAKYMTPQWMEMGKELVTVIQGKQDAEKMLINIDKNREDQATAAKDPAW